MLPTRADNLKTQSKPPNTAPNNLISGCRFATQVQIDPVPTLSRVRFAAGEGAVRLRLGF